MFVFCVNRAISPNDEETIVKEFVHNNDQIKMSAIELPECDTDNQRIDLTDTCVQY